MLKQWEIEDSIVISRYGFGVLHATQLIGHAALYLYFYNHVLTKLRTLLRHHRPSQHLLRWTSLYRPTDSVGLYKLVHLNKCWDGSTDRETQAYRHADTNIRILRTHSGGEVTKNAFPRGPQPAWNFNSTSSSDRQSPWSASTARYDRLLFSPINNRWFTCGANVPAADQWSVTSVDNVVGRLSFSTVQVQRTNLIFSLSTYQ